MTSSPIETRRPWRPVNLFWPIVLIGAGVILLMMNAGMVVQDPVVLIVQFWPVLLIVAGIEVIFSRTRVVGTVVSALLGLLVVAGAVLFLTRPGLMPRPAWLNSDWMRNRVDLRTATISQPLERVRTATVELGLAAGTGTVKAARDSNALVEGEVRYLGALTNDVRRTGDSATVRLNNRNTLPGMVNLFGLFEQRWDLRFNPNVAYDMRFNVGSGSHSFDLSEFDLTAVTLDQGSGNTALRLPEAGQYRIKLDIGSGSAVVNVPEGVAIRVNYNIGSGSLNIKDSRRVSGFGQRGTFESIGYSQQRAYAIIDLDLGAGTVTIK